jgi:hypothetical protein
MADVFVGSEALMNGVLTRGQLRWNYRAIFPDVYMRKDAAPSLSDRTIGAWFWSGRRGVIAGLAAAALHGAQWVDEFADVELIWRCGRPPPGIVVRNERIESDEIVEIAGLPVTTPERTALDIARHASRDSAVMHLDALARATGVTATGVRPLPRGTQTGPVFRGAQPDGRRVAVTEGNAGSPRSDRCGFPHAENRLHGGRDGANGDGLRGAEGRSPVRVTLAGTARSSGMDDDPTQPTPRRERSRAACAWQ